MKIVKVTASTGIHGSSIKEEFEVEDDVTEEEIQELALDVLCQVLDFAWEVTESANTSIEQIKQTKENKW